MLVTCSFTCEVLLIDPCECTPFALLDSGATFALSFPLVFVDAAEQNKTEKKRTAQKRTAMVAPDVLQRPLGASKHFY